MRPLRFVPLSNISLSSARMIFSLSYISPAFRLYAMSRSFISSMASAYIGIPSGEERSILFAAGVRNTPYMGESSLSFPPLRIGGVSSSRSAHFVCSSGIGSPRDSLLFDTYALLDITYGYITPASVLVSTNL